MGTPVPWWWSSPNPVGAVPSSATSISTGLEPLSEVLRRHRAEIPVATRPLTDYVHATQQTKPTEEIR